MNVNTFDKVSAITISLSVVFSTVVAITSWNWFPTPGDWGEIAHIPNNIINYIALLLPPIIILSYLLVRRLYFKSEF